MTKTVCPDPPIVQYGITYVSKAEDGFIDDGVLTGRGPTTLQMTVTASHDGRPVDSRLTAVINRWEARGTPGDGNSDAEIKYVEKGTLSDRLSCLPTMTDPEMWRVRIQVSLVWYCIPAPDTDYELRRMEQSRKASGPCTIVCWPVPDSQCPYYCHQAGAGGSLSNLPLTKMSWSCA